MLAGVALAAAISAVAAVLQARTLLKIPEEVLSFGVPGAAVFVAWLALWREPLDWVGRRPGPRSDRAGSGLMLFGMVVWVAMLLLFFGLTGVLAKLVSLDGVEALATAPSAHDVRLARFDYDGGACKPIWDTSHTTSKSTTVTLDLDLACPLQPSSSGAWLVARHREEVPKASFASSSERAAISRDAARRADAQFRRDLPGRVQRFTRLYNDSTARTLRPELPAG